MSTHITAKYTRMMLLTAVLLLAAATTGCDNNGDIGRWYGSWLLQEITVDGRPYTSWQSDDSWTTFAFQNNIVLVQRTNDTHDDLDVAWGTWTETNGTITMNFTHRDDTDNQYIYLPPAWIGFEPGETTFTISGPDKALILTTTHTDGSQWAYRLRKAY